MVRETTKYFSKTDCKKISYNLQMRCQNIKQFSIYVIINFIYVSNENAQQNTSSSNNFTEKLKTLVCVEENSLNFTDTFKKRFLKRYLLTYIRDQQRK